MTWVVPGQNGMGWEVQQSSWESVLVWRWEEQWQQNSQVGSGKGPSREEKTKPGLSPGGTHEWRTGRDEDRRRNIPSKRDDNTMYRVGLTLGFVQSRANLGFWLVLVKDWWCIREVWCGSKWSPLQLDSILLGQWLVTSPAESWDEKSERLRRRYEINVQKSAKGTQPRSIKALTVVARGTWT